MTYPIFERFRSFQGEGDHAGRPAFFIRTHGCPVHCPWCDSAGTWHPDHVPENIEKMEANELAKEACGGNWPVEFVVVTGGEPTVYDLKPLCNALRSSFLDVHLETSGAFPIKGTFDWITLSPKKWKMPLPENILQADEFKLIIEQPEDIAFYVQFIEEHLLGEVPVSIWLHPEWSQRKNPAILNAISKTVIEKWRGYPFRAGWQIHKMFAADLADSRSRPPVPLGGNPVKGF